MSSLIGLAAACRRSPHFKRVLKFGTVSVISTVIAQSVLFLTYDVGHIASAMVCNVIATAVSTFPAYYLNRTWTWGKRGKSHIWREVAPFWILAFIGLVFSTLARRPRRPQRRSGHELPGDQGPLRPRRQLLRLRPHLGRPLLDLQQVPLRAADPDGDCPTTRWRRPLSSQRRRRSPRRRRARRHRHPRCPPRHPRHPRMPAPASTGASRRMDQRVS